MITSCPELAFRIGHSLQFARFRALVRGKRLISRHRRHGATVAPL
jgi:hypothetical protein